jgi:hypothetical protein
VQLSRLSSLTDPITAYIYMRHGLCRAQLSTHLVDGGIGTFAYGTLSKVRGSDRFGNIYLVSQAVRCVRQSKSHRSVRLLERSSSYAWVTKTAYVIDGKQ